MLRFTTILLAVFSLTTEIDQEKSKVSPKGSPIIIDFPPSLQMMNSKGINEQGLCVWTSIECSARWQNISELYGLQKWMQRKTGGGTPRRVDELIPIYTKNHSIEYLNLRSPSLDILELACSTGRCPAIAIGMSPTGRYNGKEISHMVTLLHLDKEYACILDSNFPGTYEWCTREKLDEVMKLWSDQTWAIVFLGSPPSKFYLKKGE